MIAIIFPVNATVISALNYHRLQFQYTDTTKLEHFYLEDFEMSSISIYSFPISLTHCESTIDAVHL